MPVPYAAVPLVWLVRFVVVALSCAAAVTDVRRRVVPDWLTLPAVALGLGAFAWRLHWFGVGLWALGMAAPALPLLVPWLMGGVGGGDFKLSLAFGALGGPLFGFAALCWGRTAGRRIRDGGGCARGRGGGLAGHPRGPAAVRGRPGRRGGGGAPVGGLTACVMGAR
jgi:hypothetical protein